MDSQATDWGKKVVATEAGKRMRRIMNLEIRREMGPRKWASRARVIGKVAIRIQVATWDRSDKRPDCERARKLVPKAIEKDIKYEVALECGCVALQLKVLSKEGLNSCVLMFEPFARVVDSMLMDCWLLLNLG